MNNLNEKNLNALARSCTNYIYRGSFIHQIIPWDTFVGPIEKVCWCRSVINHIYYKWKNHFSEMKGDVGMSLHEKEGEQEDAYTETGSH